MNDRALAELGRALERLSEALARAPDDPLVVDASIQRFEFTFELFWKLARRVLAGHGVDAPSPRATLRHAYRLGWLDDEARWLGMLEDRNPTSHTYREALAREIFERLPGHAAALRAARESLARRGTAGE
ncbi:MAG TPA: HI0074 family nucleotidyltransferase substrate-binding subunit [Geminicoccaceae bacterium]